LHQVRLPALANSIGTPGRGAKQHAGGFRMHRALALIKKELLELLPPMLFFLLVFQLLSVVRSILEEQYDITAISTASAVISALVVAKSILLANATKVLHWFSKRRLIYNLLWRIALYLLIIMLFQYLEELLPLWSKTGSLAAAHHHIVDTIHWPHFWVSHIVLLIFVTFYALGVELINAIGPRQALRLFTQARAPAAPP
jgi:chromate transport protein ChrA